ncbi:hypothetical protein [Dyadobacter pollutisoli]|uniref:Uncharacterized protein n=1 Tax=Dyadobacter pollutisoli TaxID=2910158 RepID=A0A9E8N7H2_9BACT|nr:hypothetical protein [Dyadobacter pollutisoli]WAC10213.1 hypothetical protein ON006_20925 [Dyadobacter pollutisoli]
MGKVSVSHKKQTISIAGKEGKRSVSFADVAEVKTEIGKNYTSKTLREGTALVVLLVKGHYSLLFNEGNKLFYIEKNDSMLVISQQHMKRALPIIFGEVVLQAYYAKSNVKPVYSARYLTNLTVYANQSHGIEPTVFQENLNQFKTTVYIGPYLAYGYNKTAFDLNAGYADFLVDYRKTAFFTSNSFPLGLRMGVNLSRRIGIDLGAYINQTSTKNVNIDSTGIHGFPLSQPAHIREKYDPVLKVRGFSSKTIHLDLVMTVLLAKAEESKFKPYVFFGPTLAFMTKNEIKQAAGFKDNPQAETTYFYRWSKLDRQQYLVGFNSGLGINYTLSKRMTLNTSAKFIGGIFPKIRNRSFLTKIQNDTSLPDNQFGGFHSIFWHTYDQYLRMFTVGISATYKL